MASLVRPFHGFVDSRAEVNTFDLRILSVGGWTNFDRQQRRCPLTLRPLDGGPEDVMRLICPSFPLHGRIYRLQAYEAMLRPGG